MVEAAQTPARSPAIGLISIVAGVAALGLLANHPGGEANDFAGVLKNEAASRVMDAIVHGGFIAVLALQLLCYSTLSMRLGLQRIAPLAGLIFFAFGAAFMCGSLVVDGLVIPAIAAKYVAAAPAKLEFARSLFVLSGTAVQFLMPIGLIFQAAGVFSWGVALVRGPSRVTGMLGLLIGGLSAAGLAMGIAGMNPFVLMGVIAGLSVWAVAVGVFLLKRTA